MTKYASQVSPQKGKPQCTELTKDDKLTYHIFEYEKSAEF